MPDTHGRIPTPTVPSSPSRREPSGPGGAYEALRRFFHRPFGISSYLNWIGRNVPAAARPLSRVHDRVSALIGGALPCGSAGAPTYHRVVVSVPESCVN